jgi:hypothetical protein
MNTDIKIKDLWYWTANFALLASAFLSMYLNNAYPMLAVALPLIMLDRAYIVPVLLFIACIEGSFKTEDSSSQAESTAIMLAAPFFAYDFLQRNGKMVPFKFVMIFLGFGVFIIVGIMTFNMHHEIIEFLLPLMGKKGLSGMYLKMIMKAIKLCFFFLYLKVLINHHKDVLYRALTLIKDMAPYLTILVLMNMLLFGSVSSKYDTLHFGESHHGDFSANMNALGVFLYISIFDLKTGSYKRVLNLAALGCLLYIIMNLASRNGLLNFIVLGMLGGMLGLWNRNWGFKLTIVVTAMFAVGVAAYLFKDSPTVERFIDMTEAGGGDRLSYWAAGIAALHEDPIFGLGGDESASIYAVSKYAPGIDDHVMHNTFVEYAVEYGYVGFLFFMTVVCTILYHAYKNFMFAIKYNDILLAAPSICYFISIFAGLFISRVWESTLWYNMILVFGIYILYRMPVEQAMKNRKISYIHGLPDPMEDPSLAYIPTNM